MALITLQQMYDAWKRVADWVSGANTDKPPVRVTDGTDTLAINPDGSLPVQLTGGKVEEQTIFDNVAVATTVTLDVSSYASLSLNVKKLEDGMIEAFAELDTNNLVPLEFISTAGNSQAQVCERGIYVLQIEGIKKVQFKYSPSASGSRYATATVLLSPSPITIAKRNITKTVPKASVVSIKNHYEGPFIVVNDVLYAKRDYLLRKSTDWGGTWTTVHTFASAVPQACLPTKSGRIVAVLSNGEVYTSDTNGANFTQTLTMIGGAPHGNFGYCVYNDICLLAEYSSTKTPPTAKRIYMSKDAGQTWTTILDITDSPDNFHTHDVQYDPYEGIIWVTVGDGPQSKNIYYSMDMGTTWYKVEDYGMAPLQVTSIIPLPDCVLFLSDSYHVGVLRYNRPLTGTRPGMKMHFDRALVIENSWYPSAEVPIAGKAVINFEAPFACFGWFLTPNAQGGGNRLKHGNIYATRDGYKFYEVFRTDKPCNGVGISKGLGVDNNGNAVFLLQDQNQGTYPANTLRLGITWNSY